MYAPAACLIERYRGHGPLLQFGVWLISGVAAEFLRTWPGAGPIVCSCTICISAIHGNQAAPHWLQFNEKASPRSGYNSEHKAFQDQPKRLPKQPCLSSGGRHDYAERSSESHLSAKKNDCRSSRLISSRAADATMQSVVASLSVPDGTQRIGGIPPPNGPPPPPIGPPGPPIPPMARIILRMPPLAVTFFIIFCICECCFSTRLTS